MCGIFGYWDRGRRALGERELAAMAATLVHRGPDDEGIRHQRERGVAIGNRRLSIIDLAGGHQPFVSDDGQVAIVQNIPPEKLARVYSFDVVGSFVARPVGLALTGPVATATGYDTWLVVVGAVMGGSSLLALASRDVRRLERRPV